MSRHSKNNTAGSVFTYGERLKLKNLNEWGEISARIGRDSQKKFEQCSLCLKLLEEPMSCPKGHLFCKQCIIENFVMQKKEIKNNLNIWKGELLKQEMDDKNKIQMEINKKVQALKNVEDGVENVNSEINIENISTEEEIQRYKIIENIKQIKSNAPNLEKSEMTKHCFWIPEKTPEAESRNKGKPSEKLYCPIKEKDHFVKLKEMISLKLKKSEEGDKFICCICNKDLSVQKIVVLKKCGDVMCKKCLDSVCKKDENCSNCNEKFYPSEVITLQESGTGFSIHNQVETTKINPSFKF